MRVNIGPYPKDSKTKRKVRVKIHGYDTWSADHTLAQIIYPMLKQMRKQKHGAPFVDDEDAPEKLSSKNAGPKKNDWDTDEFWFKRWNYVLKEMTWTFKQLADDNQGEDKFYDHSRVDHKKGIQEQIDALEVDRVGLEQHNARINNGLRLFGKYFRSLWT